MDNTVIEIKDKGEDKIKIKKDNDKKVLKKLIKTDEWEKVKDIKEIYNEIQDYDIDKEDIGLNCSKYLNKVGDSGVFEIDELYNTCYRLKALRQKRLKKQKKEKAPKQPKGRRGGGGGAGNKQTKDTDIEKSKVNDIATKINDAIDKHYNKEDGSFNYSGFFADISGSICLNGIKNGLTAISKSFKENWDKIDDIGWSGSVWNIGKNTATELMKVVAQCPKQALGLAGFTSIGVALTYFKSVFGSIVNMVKRIGNPPSTDDDDADDDAGSGAVGSGMVVGGLTRIGPQAGVLTYSADDVEANRLNQQDLTKNKKSVQEDLENKFNEMIKQQKQNAVKEGRDSMNTIIEGDISTTDAYVANPERVKPTPKSEKEEKLTANDIKDLDPKSKNPIRTDYSSIFPSNPTRGGMFSGMNFDKKRGEATGKDYTGRAGGREFLKDAIGAYSLYRTGSKFVDWMGNPLLEPQPQRVPADDGLGFVDAEDIPDKAFRESRGIKKAQEARDRTRQRKKSGIVGDKKPSADDLDNEIQRQIDNADLSGKAKSIFLSNAMSFGGNAGKIAQNTLSPAILYLRGQNENPTLNSQSVQIQTDEETNPEMETITKQMNEDLDVINSIIDNPDAKSNEEQTQILQEQQDLMRELNTNITPVEEDDIVEEDIMDFIKETQEEADIDKKNAEELEEADIDEKGILKMREMSRLNKLQREQEELNEDFGGEIIQKSPPNEEEIELQEQLQREETLGSLQNEIIDNIRSSSIQEPELEIVDEDSSQMSLIPKPRGRKKGQTSSKMRVGMRLITGNPNQNDFGYNELLQLNNPIITEYINQLKLERPKGSNKSKLSEGEGTELLKRLGKL